MRSSASCSSPNTVVAPTTYNPTFLALVDRWDPFDYYRAEGFGAQVAASLLSRTRLTVGYADFNQYTLAKRSDFALFSENDTARANPVIADGTMRSISAGPAIRLPGFSAARRCTAAPCAASSE